MKVTCFLILPVLIAVAVAAWLQKLYAEPLVVLDPASPLHLRRELAANPNNGRLQAQLALTLLAPVDSVAPNADEDSLMGGQFTLHHPNAPKAREALEKALKAAPQDLQTHMAHAAVLMAEGKGEDAIQPARRVAEGNPKSAAAHWVNARAHLLAGCAQACEARESLRAEKRAEKKAGRKSALEEREEQAKKQHEMKQMREERKSGKDGPNPTFMDRGSLRAGSMWRVMEAGRIFQTAAQAEPEDEEARRLAKAALPLSKLDAFQVSTTEALIRYGECHHFFGQELDGHMCDKKRFKYE